jgi:hypothetical protein
MFLPKLLSPGPETSGLRADDDGAVPPLHPPQAPKIDGPGAQLHGLRADVCRQDAAGQRRSAVRRARCGQVHQALAQRIGE